MTAGIERPARTVCLLALPESTPFALYGLYEIFTSVGRAWTTLTGQETGVAPVDVKIVSENGQPFAGYGGAPIVPHAALAAVDATDAVITGDLFLSPTEDPAGRWMAECAFLRECFAAGAIVASVCSGSALLAASGLLDGRPATTHWGYADLVRRHYPAVKVSEDRILIATGPDDRIVTSGGASSYEDLALHLIARLVGRQEAIRIAKIFLFGDRGDGQMPFAALHRRRHHDDPVIADAQIWLADNYALDNPVSRLVARSGLAERTFTRRFKAATGLSPLAYLHVLRIEEAKQMLETGDGGIDQIGAEIGYEDPSFFRRLFKRQAGITLARYRLRLRRIAG